MGWRMNVKRASVSFLVLCHKEDQMYCNLTLEETDSRTLESVHFGRANNVIKGDESITTKCLEPCSALHISL